MPKASSSHNNVIVIDDGQFIPTTANKYFDNKSETIIPAHLPQTVMDEVKAAALIAFDAIDGSGLSRVDFFVNRDTHKIYINEVNTMPGFTPISMYSKLWAASGVEYSELIDQLIELALTRHSQKARLSNQV